MTRKVVITGAGRGLGAVLADLGTSAGDDVQAAMRTPKKASDLSLDVDSEASIAAFVATLERRLDQVDVLINNAGVDARAFGADPDERGPFDLTADQFLSTIRTNVVGPMLLTRGILPLLRAADGAKIINVSSQLGSMVVGKASGRDVGYNASKAALNSLTVKTAHLLGAEGITTIALHPGWLQTDMGGGQAPTSPTEAARKIWQLIDDLHPDQNGQFLTFEGEQHLW